MYGKGRYTWPDGRLYEGGFVDDRKEGEGSLTWYMIIWICRPDGKKFEGLWKAGKREGRGQLIHPGGKVEHAVWHNDVPVAFESN